MFPNMTRRVLPTLATTGLLLASTLPAFGASIVNGGFELQSDGSTSSVVGQVDVKTTLQGWTVGGILNSTQPHPFVFVVDKNADSSGFGSENSATTTIKVWGPGNGVANGFTGSPDGGNFLGVDGDYASDPVYQTVTGLTAGDSYTVSFNWAGSQFTDQTGATTQWWQVSFGSGASQDTAHTAVDSKGFTGWMSAALTFTADSASDVLTFQAKALPYTAGAPAGLPPFTLLDGVTLTDNTTTTPPPSSTPEPGTIVMALTGLAGVIGYARSRANRR